MAHEDAREAKIHVPAEPFHPWEYITDELAARGWTVGELARRMGGDADFNLCALEFLSLQDPRIRIGKPIAARLATAFGEPSLAQGWLNLDEAYQLALKAQAERDAALGRTPPEGK